MLLYWLPWSNPCDKGNIMLVLWHDCLWEEQHLSGGLEGDIAEASYWGVAVWGFILPYHWHCIMVSIISLLGLLMNILVKQIIPVKCRYNVMSTKIEIRLAKADSTHWTSLEFNRDVAVVQKAIVSSGRCLSQNVIVQTYIIFHVSSKELQLEPYFSTCGQQAIQNPHILPPNQKE